MFVLCNSPDKNRIGMEVKYFFSSKMRVSSSFYVDWELEGHIFVSKNFVRAVLQETNNFF